jgi:Flp pilus assembly protein TadG
MTRTKKQESGQSLVEFALVLPIFVVLLFGIMEFGRLWETTNVLTSAAREGARVAAVTEPDLVEAENAVRAVLEAGDVSGATIAISGPNADNSIVVTVSLAYTPMTGSIIPGFSRFQLSRSTTMRWEG